MARRMRCSDAGYVYHVHNWAVARATLFDKPADYAAFEKVICEAWDQAELLALRRSVLRGTPFGDRSWQDRTAKALGLESSFQPRGRPKKLREPDGGNLT